MNLLKINLYSLVFLLFATFSPGLLARNAPVTTAGSSAACPGGAVVVPLTVTNFTSIKAITLRLEFNPTQLTYVNYTSLNASLASASVNMVNVSPTLSKVMFVWAEINALTLANGAKLVNLNFTLTSGSPSVTFNNIISGGIECEYADENGTPMNDLPTSTYYFDALVTNNSVPAAGTINGNATVCAGSNNIGYSIPPIANATGYTWTVPPGSSIASGSNTNSIVVNYSTSATSGNVTVKGTNSCGSGPVSTLPVTVNPAPAPVIAGPASACLGSSGTIYSTATGMTGYAWNVSAGGSISGGAGTSAITVAWNSAGAQSVSVNYTNSAGCSAPVPTVKAVTVNTLPVPTITGPGTLCAGSTNVTYTTEASMNGYAWAISSGGMILLGSTTSTIQVLWTTPGPQWVSVIYTQPATGCQAAAPTVKNVTVNAQPAPAITGPVQVCTGSTGNVYTTEPGMSGYIWDVSAGGIITGGGGFGQNTITIKWNAPGTQWVSVNYTNPSLCTASSPSVKTVTVGALPVPTITGPLSVCSGDDGNVYSTEPGMNNYQWSISAGGSITAGGGTGDNTVTVSWTTPSPQTVGVNYSTAQNCTGINPAVVNVTVNPVPIPSITGPATSCEGNSGLVYYTETGMTGYQWLISPGGTINSGLGTNAISVTWNLPGLQSLSINYTNGNGCTAPQVIYKNVDVGHLPWPAGSITGSTEACAGSSGIAYSVSPIQYATSYQWTLPPGAAIASGGGTNQILVNFSSNASTGTIAVEGNNTCGNGPPSPILPVTIYQEPGNAGSVTGPAVVCAGTSGAIYSIPPIQGAVTYDWSLPAGAFITLGAGTNQVMVTFSPTPGTGIISVKGTNICGSGTPSPDFTVTMMASQGAPVVTTSGSLLTSSITTGNQWYYEGTGAIPGATGQTYTATITGWYWTSIQGVGCPVLESNHVYILFEGEPESAGRQTVVFPVPCDGQFTVQVGEPITGPVMVTVYNPVGARIFGKQENFQGGSRACRVDLRPAAPGLYTVVITGSNKACVKKVMIR